MSNLYIPELLTPEISNRAQSHYINLPYHNYEHVFEAKKHFIDICRELKSLGVDIDRNIGLAALDFHDAGYQIDHLSKGYDSKEEFSAHIATEELTEIGLNEATVEAVKRAILSTEANAVPETNLDKAVRMGDVGNVADERRILLTNTLKFALDQVAAGREIPSTFAEFCVASAKFLELYYSEDCLTFEKPDGSLITLKDRHNRAKGNIALLQSGKVSLEDVQDETGIVVTGKIPAWA